MLFFIRITKKEKNEICKRDHTDESEDLTDESEDLTDESEHSHGDHEKEAGEGEDEAGEALRPKGHFLHGSRGSGGRGRRP